MKLRAKDQVQVSAVRSEPLRDGEEFDVDDALGKELLERKPHLFDRVVPIEPAPAAKSAPAPENKMMASPANKTPPAAKKKAAPRAGKA